MTTTTKTQSTGSDDGSAQYIAQMIADAAEAQTLIDEIGTAAKDLAQQEALIGELTTIFEDFFGMSPTDAAAEANKMCPQAAADQAVITADEAVLNTLGTGYVGLENAINGLLSGLFTAGTHFDGNLDQDITNVTTYISQITAAMKDQAQVDLLYAKMNQDTGDDASLLNDAIAMMKANSAESGQLVGLQGVLSAALVTLTNQYNAAKENYDSYSWLDGLTYFCGSERDHMDEDEAIMRNCDDMRAMINNVLGDIGPVIAALQSQVFAVASLSIDKILKQIISIILDPTKSNAEKAGQIKYLMALALGILSMVESDAAQLKAENQKTMSNSMTFAVQMNISDEKSQYNELQSELKHASEMKTLMSIAKPLIEVAGMLLAPGILTFILMLALTIADNVVVAKDKDGNDVTAMDEVTSQVATMFSKMGVANAQLAAEITVGVLEVIVCLGGSEGMSKVASEATEEVAANVAREVAEVATKLVNETVQAAVAAAQNAGKTVTADAIAETRQVVQETVDKAVQKAIQKTIQQFINQAGSQLIPQLIRTGIKESTTSLAVMIAKSAEQSCVTAAKEAAELAAKDVSFFAEAAAQNAEILPEQIAEVANKAANQAVANITGSTAKDVASATERTTARRVFTTVGSVALYNAANNGNITDLVTEIIKKSGKDTDDDSIKKILEVIKILESVLAAFALAWGTGMLQTTTFESASTALLQLGALAQMTGTGLSAVSNAGQADAEMKEAPLVKSINELSVSNEMLQFMLDQLNKDAKVESDHFLKQEQEHATDYTTISHLEDSGKRLAQVLSQLAV